MTLHMSRMRQEKEIRGYYEALYHEWEKAIAGSSKPACDACPLLKFLLAK